MELSISQEDVLQALIDLFDEEPVKGREIAEAVDRTPDTTRNRMHRLVDLGLVESFAGPYGGYKPTDAAYEELDIAAPDRSTAAPIYRDGEPLSGVVVEGIDLPTVFHPDRNRAKVYVEGLIDDVHHGETVTVGPIPQLNLLIEGTVIGVFDSETTLFLDITHLEAPVDVSR